MTMRTGTKKATDRRPDWPRTADDGITLVEVVIAIALTGGIVVAIMGSLFTVIRSANQNDDASKLQAVIGGATDQLLAVDWESCPDGSDRYRNAAQAAAARVDWDAATVTVVDVDYWSAASDDWTENCSGAATPGSVDALQRITITVQAPDASRSKSFDVIKSDTRAFKAGGI